MARELGMNPKIAWKNCESPPGTLGNCRLPQFIEHCYEKQFRRKQPYDIRSIEDKETEKRVRKESRRTEPPQISGPGT